MMNALYSAATGMTAMQTGMDVIADNLANVNTTGFKSTRLSFQDLLYQQLGERQDAAAGSGSQVGMGVAPGRTEKQFTQGDLRETGGRFDLAISGTGFFQVMLPSGQIGFTRDGSFSMDANGQLVNSAGYRLEPAVVIPDAADPQSVTISSTGRVSGTVGSQQVIMGQIDIVNFVNPSGLQSLGNNAYAATAASGAMIEGDAGANGFGTIQQGVLEGSNVSVMQEMIDMINAQRAYESVSKVISTSDEMLGMANAMRR